jgi:PhnB protein
MKIALYIFFYGRCEEALEFYKSALGGDYELFRNDAGPMADMIPPDFKGKVMHATFTCGDLTFMASDGQGSKTIDPEAGNITLSLETNDKAEGDRIFKALSQGGNVKMPLQEAFWGGRFGMFDDRFGNEWMVSSP